MKSTSKTTRKRDDRALMKSLARGDEKAFDLLCRRHQGALLNFFRRLGADSHESEDASQETLARVFRHRKRYKPTAPFRSYLYTLARNVWCDALRRRQRTPTAQALELAAETLASEGPCRNDRLDLQDALATLAPGHRMVLVLSIFQGMLYREVAEVMGIPEGTVKSRVFTSLKQLRKVLDPDALAAQRS